MEINHNETGYLFLVDPSTMNWNESDRLLDGVVGVGLTFMSAIDYELMDWDECMMLS